jgi:hypothetical protein
MCLWDAETIREMQLGMSEVGRAVSGYIPKHSPFYFDAKIEYTLPMLADGGTPERWDDVAVAHEKRDRHDDALRAIDDKDRRFPGLYTTHANRGTFLARSGRLDDGIAELERALAIDPHAHFGREGVQLQLYRYLRRAASDRELIAREDFLGTSLVDLSPGDTIADDTTRAIVGMMVFGAGDRSIHLWLALGVVLANEFPHAAFGLEAIRRAEVLGHPHARDVGLRLDREAYEMHAAQADADFADGQVEVAALQAEEDARIRAGERAAVFGY